jgi:hypothetical protein
VSKKVITICKFSIEKLNNTMNLNFNHSIFKIFILVSLYVIFMSCIYISILSNRNNQINQHSQILILTPYKNEKNQQLKNPEFNYILNPKHSICKNDKNILILFYSITSASHFEKRQIIRQLWSNYSVYPQIRFVFMTGLSSNQTVNQIIKSESKNYGDIVQENFIDSYYNLTLKSIMGLKWISNYCSNSVFSVKVDDDVVINLNYLIEYLNNFKSNYINSSLENVVLCKIWYNAVVSRNNNSKFYIAKTDYSDQNYPTYCDGPAYIYSTDIANKLFKISKYAKLFKFEDVYFGMLIDIYNNNSNNSAKIVFKNYDKKYHDCFDINRNLNYYISKTCFFIYPVNIYNFIYIWNHLIY